LKIEVTSDFFPQEIGFFMKKMERYDDDEEGKNACII